jgi:two-component system sensor histidine kinase KdpD
VSVESSLQGGKISVQIADRGPGIPAGERERVFEPFQRGGANGDRSGFGLGLAIARGFVEANGGAIAVESTPGRGTTFVVSLARAGEAPA